MFFKAEQVCWFERAWVTAQGFESWKYAVFVCLVRCKRVWNLCVCLLRDEQYSRESAMTRTYINISFTLLVGTASSNLRLDGAGTMTPFFLLFYDGNGANGWKQVIWGYPVLLIWEINIDRPGLDCPRCVPRSTNPTTSYVLKDWPIQCSQYKNHVYHIILAFCYRICLSPLLPPVEAKLFGTAGLTIYVGFDKCASYLTTAYPIPSQLGDS